MQMRTRTSGTGQLWVFECPCFRNLPAVTVRGQTPVGPWCFLPASLDEDHQILAALPIPSISLMACWALEESLLGKWTHVACGYRGGSGHRCCPWCSHVQTAALAATQHAPSVQVSTTAAPGHPAQRPASGRPGPSGSQASLGSASQPTLAAAHCIRQSGILRA